MKFGDFDARMRIYETAHDHCVMPGIYMTVRLDGRCFTALTKKRHAFDAPYDIRFRDIMAKTAQHLMQCGFKVLYAYVQSDEISLLLDAKENIFDRKERKINSVLAGEASAAFSLLLGDIGVFDSRICQLPDRQLVVDYFRWRSEDARRNALNAHCYWSLRARGVSGQQAASAFVKMTPAEKKTFLLSQSVDFDALPEWQKQGFGIYWERYQKKAINPQTGEVVFASRRRLKVDFHIPVRADYDDFIRRFL